MKEAICVIGLGYGDEGKGSVTEYLVNKHNIKAVVRFNGGAQAAHNVVLRDGRHHAFSQFGSGTFAGAKTYYSSYCIFDPVSFLQERLYLENNGVDTKDLFHISPKCWIATPFHKAANRLRELKRGNSRHGSCGMGVGEVASEKRSRELLNIQVGNVYADNYANLLDTLAAIQAKKRTEFENDLERFAMADPLITYWLTSPEAVSDFADQCIAAISYVTKLDPSSFFNQYDKVVFEGAQGTLLDEEHGFHPYTTWSTTTYRNCRQMLKSIYCSRRVIGVTRAYATRHGPGPFVTGRQTSAGHSLIDISRLRLDTEHNTTGTWQGDFRIGVLDLVSLKYAIACNRSEITSDGDASFEVAVTCMDEFKNEKSFFVCDSYYGINDISFSQAVKSLPVGGDLVVQEFVATTLQMLRPHYDCIAVADIILHLERKLNEKINIISNGPTWEDKTEAV